MISNSCGLLGSSRVVSSVILEGTEDCTSVEAAAFLAMNPPGSSIQHISRRLVASSDEADRVRAGLHGRSLMAG